MCETNYKYKQLLYSDNNPGIFDIQFWLDLNKLEPNEMFIVEDEIIAAFGYKESKSNTLNYRTHFFRMIKIISERVQTIGVLSSKGENLVVWVIQM